MWSPGRGDASLSWRAKLSWEWRAAATLQRAVSSILISRSGFSLSFKPCLCRSRCRTVLSSWAERSRQEKCWLCSLAAWSSLGSERFWLGKGREKHTSSSWGIMIITWEDSPALASMRKSSHLPTVRGKRVYNIINGQIFWFGGSLQIEVSFFIFLHLTGLDSAL